MNTDKIYAERIASEYAPKTTRRIKALIRLDKWIKKPAKITAYIIGTLSAVCFLVGLTLSTVNHLYIGLIVGALGIVGMVFAPFVYKIVCTKRKNENATDVLLLAQEIIEEN